MEAEFGWENLDDDCLARVSGLTCADVSRILDMSLRLLPSQIISIFATQSLINIARPATAILRKLVLSDPAHAPPESPQQTRARTYRDSVWSYGFGRLWPLIQSEKGFWPTVERMLQMADQVSIGCLSSC